MNYTHILKSIWQSLPYSLRDTSFLRHFKRYVKKIFGNGVTISQTYEGRKSFPSLIENLNELDEAIKYAAHLETYDQDAFFNFIRSISYISPNDRSGLDPFSEEYKEKERRLFELLHSAPYQVNNEALKIYINETIDFPYPYITKSSEIVGNQLIATGHLIKAMALKPGQKVLEMGAGHGSNTLQLTQLGYEVTVIDISESFLKVIKERLRRIGKKAELYKCDFLQVIELNNKFDAVIFNASYHHSSDHVELIRRLDKMVTPQGKIYFHHEPISDHLPNHWGLRMDGESIFHIRLHGWLELGFQKSYFYELMNRNGWKVTEMSAISGSNELFCCSRIISPQDC